LLIWPGTIEVTLDVLPPNTTQLSLAEYQRVFEALPAHRAAEALADGIQIG
jgi:hypothetical protein